MEPDVNTNILGILHLKNAQQTWQKKKKMHNIYSNNQRNLQNPTFFFCLKEEPQYFVRPPESSESIQTAKRNPAKPTKWNNLRSF